MEPSFLLCIPGDIQCLQPSALELNQILLKWFYADRVFNLEFCLFTGQTDGLYEKLSAAFKEPRAGALMLKAGIIEITKNRVCACVLECPGMMRAPPGIVGDLVALRTCCAGNICWILFGWCAINDGTGFTYQACAQSNRERNEGNR